MLHKTLAGGIDPTDFWNGIYSFSSFAEMENRVREEVKDLPPAGDMSTYFLARVPYVLGAYQNRYYKKSSTSSVLDHWKNMREEWQETAYENVSDFGLKDVAESLIGFVNLNEMPPKEFLDGLYAVILNELEEDPRPKDIVRIYSAFSELGLKNTDDLPSKLKERLMDSLVEKLPTFSAKQTAEIIRSLSNLDIVPPKEFWTAYYPKAIETFGGMEAWELSGLLKPFAKWGIEPSDKAPHKFLSRYVSALHGRMGDFKPSALVGVAETFSSLGFMPKELQDNFFLAATKKLGAFNEDELSRSVRASANLGIAPSDLFLKKLADVGNFGHKKLESTFSVNILWSFTAFSVSAPLPREAMDYAAWVLKKAKDSKLSDGMTDVENTLCHLACRRLFPEEENTFDLGVLKNKEPDIKAKFLKQLTTVGFENDRQLGLIPGLKMRTDFSCLMQNNEGKKVTVLIDIESSSEEPSPDFYDSFPTLMTSFVMEGYKDRMKRDKSHTSLVYIRVPERIAKQMKRATKVPCFEKMKEVFPNLPSGYAFRLKFDGNAVGYEPIVYADPSKMADRPGPKKRVAGQKLTRH